MGEMSPEQLAWKRAHDAVNEILSYWIRVAGFYFGRFGSSRERKWCVDELADHYGLKLPLGTWQEQKI